LSAAAAIVTRPNRYAAFGPAQNRRAGERWEAQFLQVGGDSMARMQKLFVGLLLLLWVCPVSTQTPHPDSATVYFYRLREFYAEALKPSVFSDKNQLARMRNGRCLKVTLSAGEHTITSTLPGSGLVIDLKAGETYYVKVAMAHASMFHNARGEITEVAPEQGKYEVSQLKAAEPEDLKVEQSKVIDTYCRP
jgi:hypothetical protein